MVTATDRLLFTIIFSVIIHLVIILGISFEVSSPPTNQPPLNLEITLVKQQTEIEPEEADFLAQANNDGGGETEAKTPEPSPDLPLPDAAEATEAEPATEQAPTPEPLPEPLPTPTELATVMPTPPTPAKQTEIKPEPKPVKKVQPEPKAPAKIITQKVAERKVEQTPEQKQDIELAEDTKPAKPKMSARDLMLTARNEIQRLEKKLEASSKALSKKPNKLRLTSKTKQYAAAAYHEAWRKKVERIGNLNYPQQAKRNRINGQLILSVDINPDGSVPPDGIIISQSSGHKVLDDAAVKIVRLSAPFSAVPENVLQGHDMITIIRTWKFETDRGLLSR
jgi:protein TonB